MGNRTKAEFDRFKKAVEKWIDKLGLTDWNWEITFEELPEETHGRACFDKTARLARIVYNKNANSNPLKYYKPEEVALHEVLHVLFADIVPDEKQVEEHKVIARLMKVLN